MSGVRTLAVVLCWLVGAAATLLCGLVLFALVLSIGMSKTAPTFGEVFAEYWPAFGSGLLGALAVVLSSRAKIKPAIVAAIGAGLLTAWIVNQWLAPNMVFVGR